MSSEESSGSSVFCCRGGSEEILYVAQGGTADNVALDVRLPGDGVAVPLLTLTPILGPDPFLYHPA